MAEIDHFMTLLMQHEEEGLLCPVLSHGGVHFMWIKYSNLYCILILNTVDIYYWYILFITSLPLNVTNHYWDILLNLIFNSGGYYKQEF